MRTFKLVLVLPLLVASGCDTKRDSAAPATVPTSSATTPPRAPASSAPASASAAPPGKTITLRQLVWPEKTPADTKYVDCVSKACAAVLKQCYGEHVEHGELGGPCRDLAVCESRCLERPESARAACNTECVDTHRKDGSACDKCADTIDACSEKAKCEAPIALPH